MTDLCPSCGSARTRRHGYTAAGRPRVECRDCGRRLVIPNEKEKALLTEKKTGLSGVVTLDRVRDRYDIKSAILRELEKIEPGTLVAETELCFRAAGTDKNRFRRAVENNEDDFRAHRVRLQVEKGEARWYWGSAKDVAQAEGMRDQ